ncbi:hypothetical protein DSO57_1003120 [Entomophthora muscae]|uniref:Uncharacterized protein n=1 Tax=Entomophthora muscae TaxID=34485 RepID=A0ACC2UUD2_9FUNG|nr:hypothetical protein DSO57_1003120 [Entomophthora muscae]
METLPNGTMTSCTTNGMNGVKLQLSSLVRRTLDEQNEDLNADKAESVTICFDKFYRIPFLQDALPAVYTRFLHQEGPENLEDAYNCILTQYQDCVEDEPDELEREKSEWNPSAKKKVAKDVRNESSAIMDEIAVLKPFLVQHTSGPPLTCYNCQQFGDIAINCKVKQCGYCDGELHAYGVDGCGKTCVYPAHLYGSEASPASSPLSLKRISLLLSSCTPAEPKCICVAEPSPTRAPSPSCWTKAGICREDVPSPEDVDKSKKHLKLFEDAIQTLLDKLLTFLEELGDEQHQEIEARIGKHLEDAMVKIPNLDQTPENVVEEGEDILSLNSSWT